VVAISHTLSAMYLNSNESSGSTSGCNGGILHKIHNFPWSHTSTKDAYMVVIGKKTKSNYMKKNVTVNCRGFAENSYQSLYFDRSKIKTKSLEEESKLFVCLGLCWR